MTGDELDRTIEFLLQNEARVDARLEADHQRNMRGHDRFAAEQAKFQLQLNELGDHVTVMTKTLSNTLTTMNECDARQDRRLTRLDSRSAKLDSRLDRVESLLERLAEVVHRHVGDPHAHGPGAG